ncbi:hypothetical protein TNCT_454151 [Trichonephila clavata]|uniref:Uncharacterized protein n=1 Tax=Trichonephila clavata TaxID=2740835 RepID=A0A8X6J1X2_TRICU|nr:hypothetical protein TNCT_454151 [Trichonephila clavata]
MVQECVSILRRSFQHMVFKIHPWEKNHRGTEFPIAFILQIIVILVPHSPEFMLPTCFFTFGAIILAGVYTLVMPVSSIL